MAPRIKSKLSRMACKACNYRHPLLATCPLASLPFTSVLQPSRLFWGFPACLIPSHSGLSFTLSLQISALHHLLGETFHNVMSWVPGFYLTVPTSICESIWVFTSAMTSWG